MASFVIWHIRSWGFFMVYFLWMGKNEKDNFKYWGEA